MNHPLPIRRLSEARAEIESLRKALGSEPTTLDMWLQNGTQEIRDASAAACLRSSWGNFNEAMKRLGFQFKKGDKKDFMEAVQAIFMTEGCQKILAEKYESVHAVMDRLIERQIGIALNAPDETSVRAFATLAKVSGFQKTPDNLIDNRKIIVNLMDVTGGTRDGDEPTEAVRERVNALSFLEHIPGAPVRTSTNDRVDQVLETIEQ